MVSGVSAYIRSFLPSISEWIPSPCTELTNKVFRVVSDVFTALTRRHTSKPCPFAADVRTKLRIYRFLPQTDDAFLARVMKIYQQSLIIEHQDAFLQRSREFDGDSITLLMRISILALVFKPGEITLLNSPPFLRPYGRSADRVNPLTFIQGLRTQFASLTNQEKLFVLNHFLPDDISALSSSVPIKQFYLNVGAAANRLIQGNVSFNSCLTRVLQPEAEKVRLLERPDSLATSKTGWSLFFWMNGGAKVIAKKTEVFQNLDASNERFGKLLLGRYIERLSDEKRGIFLAEVQKNPYFAYRTILSLMIMAVMTSDSDRCPRSLSDAAQKIGELQARYNRLSLLDRNYVLSNFLADIEGDLSDGVEHVIRGVQSLRDRLWDQHRDEWAEQFSRERR